MKATREKALQLARSFDDLRVLTDVGCSDAIIRAVTTTIRSVAESYVTVWSDLGLPGEPRVGGRHINAAILAPGSVAITFGGAIEPPTRTDEEIRKELDRLNMKLEEGWVVANGHEGMSEVLETPHPVDMMGTFFGDVFPGANSPFRTYMAQPVAFLGDKAFSRDDFLKYAAYRLGYTHIDGKRYMKDHAETVAYLDTLERGPRYWRLRGNVDYMLLNVARQITEAEDTTRFIATSRNEGMP